MCIYRCVLYHVYLYLRALVRATVHLIIHVSCGSIQHKVVDDYKFLLTFNLLVPCNIISKPEQNFICECAYYVDTDAGFVWNACIWVLIVTMPFILNSMFPEATFCSKSWILAYGLSLTHGSLLLHACFHIFKYTSSHSDGSHLQWSIAPIHFNVALTPPPPPPSATYMQRWIQFSAKSWSKPRLGYCQMGP